jgi:multiple sugar transport system permease protein
LSKLEILPHSSQSREDGGRWIARRVFSQSSENKTVPVGVLTELVRGDIFEWGALMAGALFGSLPVVILYSFFVDHYVSSMTGAVKE